MDCSVEKDALAGPGPRPMVNTWVGGERLEAIIDTGCSDTCIQSKLAPSMYVQKANPVKMTCMHGHSTFYPRWVYEVMVLGTTREMPIRLARDLPYPMILGWDWHKIYEVLKVTRNVGVGGVGLAEDTTEDLDLEQLTGNRAFRKAQEEE